MQTHINIAACCVITEYQRIKQCPPIILSSHIQQRYGVEPEYPWAKFPDYAVFRHCHHRKWFAVLMNIEANKIGLNAIEKIWVLNVKAKPEEIGSLRMIKGVYPAYHMKRALVELKFSGN